MRATAKVLCGVMWLVAVASYADAADEENAEQPAPPMGAAAPPSEPAPPPPVAAQPSPEQVDRKGVLTANVVFGKDEATGFWPLYRDYRRDVDALQAKREHAINTYAEIFRTMTADQAKSMVEDLLQADESLVKVKRDYLKKFRKVLPETKVTRVLIIDGGFDILVNRALLSKVPLAADAAGQTR
ncbi:MAG TPA: hypothetical protein VIZ30_03395 [Pseudomonadales bacterium]